MQVLGAKDDFAQRMTIHSTHNHTQYSSFPNNIIHAQMVGHPDALKLAFSLCRPGGVLSSIGVYGDAECMPFRPVDLYNKNMTLRSGRCPARRLIHEAALVAQRFPVTDIVSHVVGLEEGPDMYEAFCGRRGCMKVLFQPWGSAAPR